ncbi:hypothetical protein [Streptomyces sp. NPDC044948]|uniref:hypothetical protein n=1 Tax=Streptomyces sp. NPDC044948 TaxID=3157092 RepID=UPI0033E18172
MSEPIVFGRPFVLQRDRDVSGVSGTGVIADGVLFPDGHAVIHWRGKWPLTTPHPDGMASIIGIHDHGGRGDLHVIWPDEQYGDRPYLQDRIGQALAAAADSSNWGADGAVRWMNLSGDRDNFVNAVMETVDQLAAQRNRAQRTAGRAYQLADRWEAAHGSAHLLVRAAGVELREVLDSTGDEPGGTDPAATQATDGCTSACDGGTGIRGLLEHVGIGTRGRDVTVAGQTVDTAAPPPDDMDDVRQHYLGPGAQPCTKHRGRAERQRWGCNGPDPTDQDPPIQGPLAGIEVRDPCPHCEGGRLIPRTLLDSHIHQQHPEVRDDSVELAREALLARVGDDQAEAVDRLIRAVEHRNYCDLPHEMEV